VAFLLLLGYLLGRNQVYVGNTAEQGESLSWSETVIQDKKLLLEIRGRINPTEREIVDRICLLSVINSRSFYLNGVESKKDNSCQDNSTVNLQKDGNWKFEHTFSNPQRRIIRIEKIYKEKSSPGSDSYIDFSFGRSIGQN
jgi:hypothetical protein